MDPKLIAVISFSLIAVVLITSIMHVVKYGGSTGSGFFAKVRLSVGTLKFAHRERAITTYILEKDNTELAGLKINTHQGPVFVRASKQEVFELIELLDDTLNKMA